MPRGASEAILKGAALAAALLLISLLASCGGGGGSDSTAPAAAGLKSIRSFGAEASPADRDAAGKVVEGFLRARANGDWPKACSLIAASVVGKLRQLVSQAHQLKNTGCTELVKAATAALPRTAVAHGARIRVTGARIEGDFGFVLYRDAGGTSFALPVAREPSSWKAGALVGQPLSPQNSSGFR